MSILSFANEKVLKLSEKLGVNVASFDTSVGRSCPGARDCLVWVAQDSDLKRHLCKGVNNKFTCYAATAELIYPSVYERRLVNYGLVNGKIGILYDLIDAEIKRHKVQVLRVHSAGDISTAEELNMWHNLALLWRDVMFYGYTKNMTAVTAYRNSPLDNLKFVYSYGGLDDIELLSHPSIPVCYVVKKGLYFPDNLPIAKINENQDYEFILSGQSFGIKYH